ncbi:uncharacterized protein BO88DRAFT_421307 [Aspergillus vadensis CBS 113365]|uniref:Uncharacterized protein n=1 Tax=Aspergillus vadensis (strain CBS 113365 / IMI 142717 / IBT 24658) TaxID=1448311 RepID=A0A319BNQ4_ASPVC|nr:hypothetical protein BO88DRAFT_421307 [Aspergillus vadensis CBS 113365]PYH74996.1 hypothetical protein BO88DRAFT_421307 [Aspergillus vadensis CBS 113365]
MDMTRQQVLCVIVLSPHPNLPNAVEYYSVWDVHAKHFTIVAKSIYGTCAMVEPATDQESGSGTTLRGVKADIEFLRMAGEWLGFRSLGVAYCDGSAAARGPSRTPSSCHAPQTATAVGPERKDGRVARTSLCGVGSLLKIACPDRPASARLHRPRPGMGLQRQRNAMQCNSKWRYWEKVGTQGADNAALAELGLPDWDPPPTEHSPLALQKVEKRGKKEESRPERSHRRHCTGMVYLQQVVDCSVDVQEGIKIIKGGNIQDPADRGLGSIVNAVGSNLTAGTLSKISTPLNCPLGPEQSREAIIFGRLSVRSTLLTPDAATHGLLVVAKISGAQCLDNSSRECERPRIAIRPGQRLSAMLHKSRYVPKRYLLPLDEAHDTIGKPCIAGYIVDNIRPQFQTEGTIIHFMGCSIQCHFARKVSTANGPRTVPYQPKSTRGEQTTCPTDRLVQLVVLFFSHGSNGVHAQRIEALADA